MKRLRANRAVVAELRLAKKRLDALITEESTCGVEPEHKEAVRLYVQTWITPLVTSALDRIEGRKPTSPQTSRGLEHGS